MNCTRYLKYKLITLNRSKQKFYINNEGKIFYLKDKPKFLHENRKLNTNANIHRRGFND